MNPPGLPSVEDLVLQERLKLLAIATTVSGAVKAIMVSFLIFHLAIFTAISVCPSIFPVPPAKPGQSSHATNPDAGQTTEGSAKNSTPAPKGPPAELRWVFGGIALVIALIMLGGWTLGGLLLYSAHCIRKRKHLVFIQSMAAIQCIFIPYGTLIGIFTFYTLGTQRAQALFKTN